MSIHLIDPDLPQSDQIETIEDALLVPIGERKKFRRTALGGVVRPDGSFVENSHAHIEPGRTATKRPPARNHADVGQIRGTWLYGGRHDLRFGHFLVETIARLWALDHMDTPPDGIVFLPQAADGYGNVGRRIRLTQPMFDLFGDLPKLVIRTRPARFERLIVPPQGCGSGQHAASGPEFRAFVKRRFAKSISPAGPDKLYVSRSRLLKTPGQVLFEKEIEEGLAAEGYTVIHPQEHPVPDQIAMYRAARKIIGTESSAFHLMALAMPTAKVGIIRRRNGDKSDGFSEQLRRFTGQNPVMLGDVVESFAFPNSDGKANALLDMPALATALQSEGFVSSEFTLAAPDKDQTTRAKDDLHDKIRGVSA